MAGGGLGLALACDFTVAQETAKFVFAFVNIGYVPDMGCSLLLARAVGRPRAIELAMLENRFSGAQAAQWGLITEALPAEEVASRVLTLATKLANGPTLAYGKMKKVFNRILFAESDDIFSAEFEYQYQLCKSADHAEAVGAFFDKRKPNFQGL